MSEDSKRKRSPNWLLTEKELLLSLVQLHFNIIENKKTDGVTIKRKLAQWQIIADQYNSRTSHGTRTGENLKAQWECMKKTARKAAKRRNRRNIMIQTRGGSPMPEEEDPFLQQILSLISTSAVGLFNTYNSDSIVPAVQDQAIPYKNISLPPTVVDNQISDTTVHSNEDFVTKDWGDYTPQSLMTPVSQALRSNDETVVKNKRTTENIMKPIEKQARTRQAWISLEQLHKKKIEAIDLQKQLAAEEMERSKVLHDLDIQIKKQILRQEKIKTNILLIKRRRLLAHKKSTIL